MEEKNFLPHRDTGPPQAGDGRMLQTTTNSSMTTSYASQTTRQEHRVVPLNLPMAQPVVREFRSEICCGIVEDPRYPDQRTMMKYCAYFGEEVELFVAEVDPLQQTLYRPSLLSKKFGWSTNRVIFPTFLMKILTFSSDWNAAEEEES
jgi:hypothetical protein